MGLVLVTGNPGSGKTTLARELSGRGYAAVDADELAGWETESGAEVTEPADATDAWRLAHRWVWRRDVVARLASDYAGNGRHLFVCGIARNQRDLLDLFDAVFLLALDESTQEERLRTPDNAERGEGIRAQIRAGRPVFEQEMRSAGALVLDARLPTARSWRISWWRGSPGVRTGDAIGRRPRPRRTPAHRAPGGSRGGAGQSSLSSSSARQRPSSTASSRMASG